MKEIKLKGFEHLIYNVETKDDRVRLTLKKGNVKAGDREEWQFSKECFDKTPKTKVDGVYVYDIRKMPKPTKTQEEKRKNAYNVLIPRDMLDAYITYTIEGDTAKAEEIAAEIRAIKAKVRENFPNK